MQRESRGERGILSGAIAAALLVCVWLFLVGDVLVGRASVVPLPSQQMMGIEYEGVTDLAEVPTGKEPVATLMDYPALVLIAQGLRQGGLFQLNPWMGTGHPLLADLYGRPFSIFTLPTLLWPTLAVFSFCHTLHLLVALLGAYLLLRVLGASRSVSVAVAIFWSTGGYLIGLFSFNQVAGAALFPFILRGVVLRLRRGGGGLRSDLFALALCAWAGHVSNLVYATVVWLACVGAFPAELPWRRRMGMAVEGLLLTFLVTAPLTFPFLINIASLNSYKEFAFLPFSVGPVDFLLRRGALYLSPLLFLLLCRPRDPLVRQHAVFWSALFFGALALVLLFTRLPPSFVNRYFNLNYTVPFLLLLACAAVVSTRRSDGEREPGLSPFGLGTALALVIAAAVARSLYRVEAGVSGWLVYTTAALCAVGLLVAALPRLIAPAAPALRVLREKSRRPALIVSLILLVGTSLHQASTELYKTPPGRLRPTHPFAEQMNQQSPQGRIAVLGAKIWDHPLPPNLAFYWGLADIAVSSAVVTRGYLESYLEVFGLPYFLTMFVPIARPQMDPASLGVARVFWFDQRQGDWSSTELGGYITGWRAEGEDSWTPLVAPRIGYRGTWQTFSWSLPPAAARRAGQIEVKLTPLAGYRYADENGQAKALDLNRQQRWVGFPTAAGQAQASLLYREDGYWLGLAALLAGLGSLVLASRRGRSGRAAASG